ncbi:unnamed protein product [Dibothriocephalus latus]|uniref:Uncharacterized protein n=1 Tax=Dibothriocephalus latus TaxID=60516 RepID=A0A3P7LWN3_DIBLA|nr:unnamed protein product [Dibothriocephalus latus]
MRRVKQIPSPTPRRVLSSLLISTSPSSTNSQTIPAVVVSSPFVVFLRPSSTSFASSVSRTPSVIRKRFVLMLCCTPFIHTGSHWVLRSEASHLGRTVC